MDSRTKNTLPTPEELAQDYVKINPRDLLSSGEAVLDSDILKTAQGQIVRGVPYRGAPVLRWLSYGGSSAVFRKKELLIPRPAPSSTVKDSGKREAFSTGSQRDTRDGKGRYDLLPTRGLERVALRFEAGATKYGDRNWEKGQPVSRFLDSGLRHAFKALQGETDEDHLAAAVWNLLCAIDTLERIKIGALPSTLNDLPATYGPVNVSSNTPTSH